SRMRRFVSSLTSGLSRSALDTVEKLTPARSAISLMVTMKRSPTNGGNNVVNPYLNILFRAGKAWTHGPGSGMMGNDNVVISRPDSCKKRGGAMQMNLFDLTGTVSVVIGGNGVLGGAMSEALALAGSKVAVVGRNMEKAEAVCARIASKGGTAVPMAADATKREDLERLLENVLQWGGRVETLINASGVNSSTPLLEPALGEWDRIMDVNLKSG